MSSRRCVTLLENTPNLGAPFRMTLVLGVRRIVMKKTKHFVYYVHDSLDRSSHDVTAVRSR